MTAQQDSHIDALLVGYENQENLGLRSILSYLGAQGYKATLVPFIPGKEAEVVELAQELRPRLIGFSLIFQYTLDEFQKLAGLLRVAGIKSHFTAGGHFPSLSPEETFRLLPELDSIVRFEGELTLSDLLGHLAEPNQWQHIQGLAFRRGSDTILTPTRPLIADLDSLPPIFRDKPREAIAGLPMASMLASRGCLFNCSFCSIRQFYGKAQGALRRVRSPQAVANEMATLFNQSSVRFFSFQDDDFAAHTRQQRGWLQEFLKALDKAGLANQVRWKISCRVDDVQRGILEEMLSHGLIAVYLGVESGSELGLLTLNKRVSVNQNLAAIELIKSYDIALAIGFMLFDPSSTVETIRENLNFMQAIGEDGYFPINFCKMLPYAGTPIESQLRHTGRLKGTVTRPDYDFLERQVDWYSFLVQRIFTRRNFDANGLVARLQQADFDYRLARAFGYAQQADGYAIKLRQLIVESNKIALEVLFALLEQGVSRGIDSLLEDEEALPSLAEREWLEEARVEIALDVPNRSAFSVNTASISEARRQPDG